MKKGLKIILLIVLITGIGLISYILINNKIETSKMEKAVSIPFLLLMPDDFRNPETSLKYGFKGYIEIGLLDDSVFNKMEDKSIIPLKNGDEVNVEYKNILYLKRGDEVNIPLSLHFVSHVNKEIDKVGVILDTMKEVRGERLISTKDYGITDENGNVIKRGEALINELISYEPNYLVLKDGETKNIVMKIKIPKDFPPVIHFQIDPMGIYADIDEKIAVFQNETIDKMWEVVIND